MKENQIVTHKTEKNNKFKGKQENPEHDSVDLILFLEWRVSVVRWFFLFCSEKQSLRPTFKSQFMIIHGCSRMKFMLRRTLRFSQLPTVLILKKVFN